MKGAAKGGCYCITQQRGGHIVVTMITTGQMGLQMKLRSGALIILAFLFSASVAAQPDPVYLNLAKAFVSKEVGPKWRQDFLTTVKSFCENAAVKVPRNTPDEDKWVIKEIVDSLVDQSQERQIRLHNSKEHARYVARLVLDRCVSLSDLIFQTRNNVKEEAALWAELAWQFSTPEDYKQSAEVLGLYSSSHDTAGVGAFRTIHQAILSKAIVPMLRE